MFNVIETGPIIGGILILLDWVIRIAALIIVPRDRKPTAAMAWLLAIFLIPFIGVILFLLIGDTKLPRKRRERQEDLNRLIAERANSVQLDDDSADWPDWFASLTKQNQTNGAMPGDRGQFGEPDRRLPRLDRGDGGGDRHRRAVRARRVLHRRVG